MDRELEQHPYNLISDNTPVVTPEPNEDEVQSCMDIIVEWISDGTHWTQDAWNSSSCRRNVVSL